MASREDLLKEIEEAFERAAEIVREQELKARIANDDPRRRNDGRA